MELPIWSHHWQLNHRPVDFIRDTAAIIVDKAPCTRIWGNVENLGHYRDIGQVLRGQWAASRLSSGFCPIVKNVYIVTTYCNMLTSIKDTIWGIIIRVPMKLNTNIIARLERWWQQTADLCQPPPNNGDGQICIGCRARRSTLSPHRISC